MVISNSTSAWSQTMNKALDNENLKNNDTDKLSNNKYLPNTTTKWMPLQDENPNSSIPRKRNNSLIPKELMINNSGEGGRERAALATVFGVHEYIDSNVFWERRQNQTEPKKAPINKLNHTAQVDKYGHVSVSSVLVDRRPIASSPSTNTDEDEDLSKSLDVPSTFFISSYLDSVLSKVGSNDLFDPSLLGVSDRSNSAPTKSFSLPDIPTVSTFNDVEFDDQKKIRENTLSFKLLSESLLEEDPTEYDDKENSGRFESHLKDEDRVSIKSNTNMAVIVGPPEIFDLITSDDDERFIVWGPDPILLSSSMATTTNISEKPSSYANLYNNQYKRPELKAFSSNTTSTLISKKLINNNNTSSRSSFISAAQHWSENLKLQRPRLIHSLSETTNRDGSSESTLRKTFSIRRIQGKKSKKLQELEKNNLADIPKVIEAASVHKLIEKLTNTLDYTLMTDFFLTYRDFLNSEDLCKLLISRFYWALQNDDEMRKIVRIRTFVVFRHWLNNYFVHDFIGNRRLRVILTDFLNELPRHPLVRLSPRDQRIVKILKRVIRRLKKLYYIRSSGASRVKVIPPPPPTAEQEEMSEIIRAKLTQGVIRRKTALGLDMSSHHHGNMAVQDARYAPIVVVGSLSKPRPISSVYEDNQTIRSSLHPAQFERPVSISSDNSLESDLSAGDTIPNLSDHSEDEFPPSQGLTEDEHDREWYREQQETLEYFRLASETLQVVEETPKRASVRSLFDDDLKLESDRWSHESPKGIPDEIIVPKSIRRVPSERWCKSDDQISRHPLDTDQPPLPEELLKELDEVKSPIGLSRKLSKKSIERRKSEKSLHEAAASAASSAATSPYLNGRTADVPDVPELPPLTPGMFEPLKLNKKPSRILKKKKSGFKVNKATDQTEPVFASIRYESTEILNGQTSEDKPEPAEPSKRRISRALSKVFRHGPQEEEKVLAEPKPDQAAIPPIPPVSPIPDDTFSPEPEQQNSRLVSMIAQRLRYDSIDETNSLFDGCSCAKCSGNIDSTSTCHRLSLISVRQEDRRQSFDLRRRRGASFDSDQPVKKTGPVYLGYLSNKQKEDDRPHLKDESDDESVSTTGSSNTSEKSVQASSVRARMSMISDGSGGRSKMIESDIPPLSSEYDQQVIHQNISKHAEQLPEQPPSPIPAPVKVSNERCFIMSYRTSVLASQLCFVERDVLIKVGWEELVHCKWTKINPNGKPNRPEKRESLDEEKDGEQINYTRQTEKRRIEEQGIEQVIQRFNIMCQWVSSEIVRTKNMNERVKLIEKFIKLAKKCKMYSNYATLVQILLGLQSPAVARLEKTWSKVSPKCQKLLDNLTEFTSPMKNWKNIRDSMTEVAEEYGNSPAEVQVELPGTTSHRKFSKTTKIKIPFGGCIPFLGIYLSDLVFNFEKPRYLRPNLESQRIYMANNTRKLPACLDQPLVNFRKHRVIATVIKRVLTFQSLAMRYSFDEDQYLMEKCRDLEVLDAAKIRELSASLE